MHLVSYAIFWINEPPPSKPGAGLSDTKFLGKLVLGTVVNYRKVCRLHPGEYVQLNQEDEPLSTIEVDRDVGVIILGPQNNLEGDYLFDILLTV